MTTNEQPAPDFDGDLRVLETTANQCREKLLAACRRAVADLEQFAARARRDLERAADETDPHRLVELPGKVLTGSAWGTANAAGELEVATRWAIEYMDAILRLQALKKGA